MHALIKNSWLFLATFRHERIRTDLEAELLDGLVVVLQVDDLEVVAEALVPHRLDVDGREVQHHLGVGRRLNESLAVEVGRVVAGVARRQNHVRVVAHVEREAGVRRLVH